MTAVYALLFGLLTGGVIGFLLGCWMVFRDFGDVIDAGRIALYDQVSRCASHGRAA